MKIDTKATIQEHSKWIAEKVAEAKELGIRDGVDGLKVGHVIALLFAQVESLEKDNTRLRDTLIGISLSSQYTMGGNSTDLGRMAREALGSK